MSVSLKDSGRFDFAATLRDARSRTGLTQAQAAKRLGLSQSQVSLYESGVRHPPLERAWQILSALGWQMSARPMDDPGDDTRLPLGEDRWGNRHYWGFMDGPLVILGESSLRFAYLTGLGQSGLAEVVEDPVMLAALAETRRRVIVEPAWEATVESLDQSLTVVSVSRQGLLLSVGGQRIPLSGTASV